MEYPLGEKGGRVEEVSIDGKNLLGTARSEPSSVAREPQPKLLQIRRRPFGVLREPLDELETRCLSRMSGGDSVNAGLELEARTFRLTIRVWIHWWWLYIQEPPSSSGSCDTETYLASRDIGM